MRVDQTRCSSWWWRSEFTAEDCRERNTVLSALKIQLVAVGDVCARTGSRWGGSIGYLASPHARSEVNISILPICEVLDCKRVLPAQHPRLALYFLQLGFCPCRQQQVGLHARQVIRHLLPDATAGARHDHPFPPEHFWNGGDRAQSWHSPHGPLVHGRCGSRLLRCSVHHSCKPQLESGR